MFSGVLVLILEYDNHERRCSVTEIRHLNRVIGIFDRSHMYGIESNKKSHSRMRFKEMTLRKITCMSVETINTLLIGPAGIGKTGQIAKLLKDGKKVVVLSAEGGLLSVRMHVKSGQVIGWEIMTIDDLREAYKILTSDKQLMEEVEWVFIDSLTEISGRCVEAVKAKYPAASDSFKMWADYNDAMTAIIKSFRDLKQYNVVFTALDTVEKDELNRRYVGPAIAGNQLKDRLTSYFDEVLYMTTIKGEDGTEQRVFITQPYERYPAKDRSGKLDLIEKPDLAYIRDKILDNDNPTNGGN